MALYGDIVEHDGDGNYKIRIGERIVEVSVSGPHLHGEAPTSAAYRPDGSLIVDLADLDPAEEEVYHAAIVAAEIHWLMLDVG